MALVVLFARGVTAACGKCPSRPGNIRRRRARESAKHAGAKSLWHGALRALIGASGLGQAASRTWRAPRFRVRAHCPETRWRRQPTPPFFMVETPSVKYGMLA